MSAGVKVASPVAPSEAEAAAVGVAFLSACRLFQQLEEGRERLRGHAHGRGPSLLLAAGPGGIGYGSGPADIQPGSSAFAHVEHV